MYIIKKKEKEKKRAYIREKNSASNCSFNESQQNNQTKTQHEIQTQLTYSS